MQKLYEQYGLPMQIPGYPSLDERLKLSQNTADQLQKLHNVLETANLLTLIEAHETANDYYRFLLNEYQSYEVYNNAAVNAILAALKLMDPTDLPYALPLELDASSRLEQLDTRLPAHEEKRWLALLKTAEQWLQQATRLSDQDAVSYLNLAIVYTLKNNWFEAEYQANKALNIAKDNTDAKTTGDAQIILGIIAALQGQKEQARTFFQAAHVASPYLARLNLSLLDGPLTVENTPPYTARGVEKIDGVNLDDFLEAPEVDVTTDLTDRIFCGKKSFTASQLYMHYADDGEEYAVFQKTTPDYDGQTRTGIKKGASIAEVKAGYGSPDAVLNLRQGSCLRFDKHKLLFIFSETDTLSSWVTYRTNL
jgi:tetratricopeptide (TPR) repeat protein